MDNDLSKMTAQEWMDSLTENPDLKNLMLVSSLFAQAGQDSRVPDDSTLRWCAGIMARLQHTELASNDPVVPMVPSLVGKHGTPEEAGRVWIENLTKTWVRFYPMYFRALWEVHQAKNAGQEKAS